MASIHPFLYVSSLNIDVELEQLKSQKINEVTEFWEEEEDVEWNDVMMNNN